MFSFLYLEDGGIEGWFVFCFANVGFVDGVFFWFWRRIVFGELSFGSVSWIEIFGLGLLFFSVFLIEGE